MHAWAQASGNLWTPQTPAGTSGGWADVCYSPVLDLFCAVSNGNNSGYPIMTSQDGKTWTGQAASIGNILNGVCWSPTAQGGCFCAVGGVTNFQRNVIYTSTDGINWTSQAVPAPRDPLMNYLDVCWSPSLGLFVAVGMGAYLINQITTSPDGITWTVRPPPFYSSAYRPAANICWSPDLGLFVGGGYGFDIGPYVITSTNGTSWSITLVTPQLIDIAWSPALGKFCGVASNDTHVYLSTNGTTWTAYTFDATETGEYGVCWSASKNLFALVGDKQYTSANGQTWSISETLRASGLLAVAENGTIFVAVGGTLVSIRQG
jgi:hypothetical protein